MLYREVSAMLPTMCQRVTGFGLFQKKITFLVRKFQKFCVWLLTFYAFIICQVIIRTQYYTNASLISALVVILYQNVRGA